MAAGTNEPKPEVGISGQASGRRSEVTRRMRAGTNEANRMLDEWQLESPHHNGKNEPTGHCVAVWTSPPIVGAPNEGHNGPSKERVPWATRHRGMKRPRS